MNFWKLCTASQYSVCMNSLRSSFSPLSYIAVFTVPGSMMTTSMPNNTPQRVRHSFKTKFGSAIGTEKRDSNFCNARGDVHNAPWGPLPLLVRSQQRREGLDYDERRDHVDLQLPPVLAGPQMEQRPADYNSCIVHQANKIPVADHGVDLPCRLMDSIGVRNVHHERHKAVPELSLQTIGVSWLAYRTEDAKSLCNKHLCGSPTNSGGNSGDHDISAVPHRITPKM